MEDVREYYPIYLGCDVMVTTNTHGLQGPPNTFKGVLRGYTLDQWKQQEFAPALQVYISDTTYYFYKPEQVKLIVRRLDSMTEEEAKDLINLNWRYKGLTINIISISDDLRFYLGESIITRYLHFSQINPLQFYFLLSKGFWLFSDEAFDKGLIIDSKTLNKEA